MTRKISAILSVAWMAAALSLNAAAATIELGNEAPWYFSPALGVVDFEGDQEYSDGLFLSARLGYDFNDRWTFEAEASLAPLIDSNRVSGRPAPDWNDTQILALALDGLFHFTRWERLDPYLAAGIGVMHYGEEPANGSSDNLLLRGGGGVMYHFNDEWAVRADYRGILAGFGDSPNANAMFSAGLVWNWGARVPPKFVAVGSPNDSDGDGLTDVREVEIGTDPFDPDTDRDGLTDGDEVNRYTTNPLNADTDWDGLSDGDEVLKHNTDPKIRDTDSGGVADGHEVIEDETDPRNPADDLMLIELYIPFEYDSAVIPVQSYPKLDVVAKVLQRNPDARARIEGHADRTRKSGEVYNTRLSRRRAGSVADYLTGTRGIASERLNALGYGFSRPKEKNDPIRGNPMNRRVEVYISGATDKTIPAEEPASGPGAAVPVAADK